MMKVLLFSWNATALWLLCGASGLLAVLLVLLSGRLPEPASGGSRDHETLASQVEE